MKRTKSNNVSRVVLFQGDPNKHKKRARRYNEVYFAEGSSLTGQKVEEDLFTYVDLHTADYLAGKRLETFYQQFTKEKERDLLNALLGSEYGHLYLKKHILIELRKIYTARIYLDKFIERYGKRSHFDFIPKNMSYEVYQCLNEMENIFPPNVRIPEWYLRKIKVKEYLKRILHRYAILGFPLLLALYMTWKREAQTALPEYKFGMHAWDTGTHHFLPPYTIRFFDKLKQAGTPVLIVIDSGFRGSMSKRNLRKIKRGVFDVCYFFDLIRQIDIRTFFLMVYTKLVRSQIQLFCLRAKTAAVRQINFKLFMKLVTWEIFFSKFKVKRFITLQTPGDIATSLIQQKNKSRSSFIFLSSSYDCIPIEDSNALSDGEYSHMYFNDFTSSRVSIEYFKKNENQFENYFETGVLSADDAYRVKNDPERKAKIKKKLGIPKNVQVVGLFDTTIGKNGMFDLYQGLQMATNYYELVKQNKQVYYLFKTRTVNKLPADSQVKQVYDLLRKNERVCFIYNEPGFKSTKLMGICDLVISAYSSSVSLEAASGGIKSIFYTPEKFLRKEFPLTHFPKFCARNIFELQDLQNYWLNECNASSFRQFQDNYIKPYIDSYCDGSANSRLEKFMNL